MYALSAYKYVLTLNWSPVIAPFVNNLLGCFYRNFVQLLMSISTRKRVVLTGTPIQVTNCDRMFTRC